MFQVKASYFVPVYKIIQYMYYNLFFGVAINFKQTEY